MGLLYNISTKVGEYEKDGKTKNKYATLGSVIETKKGHLMLKLETIPVNWDGFAYLNEPEIKYPKGKTADVVLAELEDEGGVQVDLGNVPF